MLLEVSAQLLVHFVGRRLYALEAEATGKPAVKEGAGEGTDARACIQQAAGLQGAGREHARHEAGHARRGHELAQLRLVLLSGTGGHLAAHAVCGVKLLKHSVSSSLARRDDADVFVKGGAGHAIAAGHVCHLNVWVTQKRLDLSHLLIVQLRLAATGPATGTGGS